MATTSQFITMAETALGTPYVLGGINLHKGVDCSGLIYGSLVALGVNPGPRTTESMWTTWPKITAAQLRAGDLIQYKVPADGGVAPQHVMIYIAPGMALEAPHTGAVVHYISPYPNTNSESIMGYQRIPMLDAPVTPPMPVPPPFSTSQEVNMTANDPVTGGYWYVDARDGHVEAYDGAPFLGGLNSAKIGQNPITQQHIGSLAGATAVIDGDGKWGLAITLSLPNANAKGEWSATYVFPRSAVYA